VTPVFPQIALGPGNFIQFITFASRMNKRNMKFHDHCNATGNMDNVRAGDILSDFSFNNHALNLEFGSRFSEKFSEPIHFVIEQI
jgi:hypothetical protein